MTWSSAAHPRWEGFLRGWRTARQGALTPHHRSGMIVSMQPAAYRGAKTALLVTLTFGWASGCTVSFAHRLPVGSDGGADGSLDASVVADGSLDASVIADSTVEPLDAAPDALGLPDAQADAGCAPGTKWCDTTCVSVDSPATGCAQPSCEPCSYDHASAICVGGACALGLCENQWGNCDMDPATGCETDLTSTLLHCSACNQSCALPQAEMSCVGGGCQFLGCMSGYQNCDGNIQLNGCETDIGYDDQNCGSCGNVCYPGFDCNNTACRCSSSAECDTGGGGTCDSYYRLCKCPVSFCYGPCNAAGTGCL